MAFLSDIESFFMDEINLKNKQQQQQKKIGKRKKENNFTIWIQNLEKLAPGP